MKVLAMSTAAAPLTEEQIGKFQANEVAATLKLYCDGKIEQFWLRQDKPGAVFLMNVDSTEQAEGAINALPLTAAGIVKYEFISLAPLAPLVGGLLQLK